MLGRPDLAPEDASSADEIRARMLGILDAMRAECGETATGLADDVPALVDFLRAFADGEP